MIAGVALSVALLLLLVAVAAGACGNHETALDTTRAEDNSSTTASPEESRERSGPDEKTGADTGKDAEKPYAAIAPAEDAVPLAKNIEDDYAQRVLKEEDLATTGSAASAQYGEETTGGQSEERSVPLGQTLLAGKEDPSDGPLKENRIVAYYGTPASELMGVLGESKPEAMMEDLKKQTAAYSNADPERPAVPAIEFIASIAQRDPGPDGLYVSQADPKVIEQYANLAEENDALLILDVQLGRATVMQEIEILEPFLKRPNVHLAIDTEYSIDAGQVPGQDLGTVDGSEIQDAVEYLDALAGREDIPDKLLMVHEFQQGIVANKQVIQPTEDVEIALHADGFGAPEDKFAKYGLLARDEPIQYGGFKVFYQQDTPVLEPKQVLALDPAPAVVTYQ